MRMTSRRDRRQPPSGLSDDKTWAGSTVSNFEEKFPEMGNFFSKLEALD